MVLWSERATAIAPMDEISCLSKSGVQFAPPSTVFQPPPATAPKYQVLGSPGTPSIASARPPRNGPTCRHCIPEKSFGSICGAGVGDALGDGDGAAQIALVNAKTRKAKKERRPREFMTRKFQTYVRPSTTNAAATILCMLSSDDRCQKISGIMINLPFGGGNNLREI